MRKWAEIYKGLVVSIHDMPDDIIPEFNPSSMRYLVEVTNEDPMPDARWKYDVQAGTFSTPDPVAQNPITSKEFFERFTGAERETFMDYAEGITVARDKKVSQFSYWLTLSGDVDLTDSKVIAGTNYLETATVIGAGRAAEILTITYT